ncbi:phosphonate metabolism protein [Escherichia coli]|uniref:Phosphonate metabolism protein n=1 Tax=Escherichia coli TaxID=562 RepID=A0A2X1N1Q0_ECOLX|nr:phosphonate metabolism protein [Escherichia coli]
MGGTGRTLFAGDATLTRAAVRLTDGTLGYSWVLGRDKQHAERCALIDALMQQSRHFQKLIRNPYCPAETLTVWHALPHARPNKRQPGRLFTMVRGDNA